MPPAQMITPELAQIIVQRVSSGRTLASVAKDDDMPCYDTMYQQMHRDESFADLIARARKESAHVFAQQTIDIADEKPESSIDTQWARNRCDQRRWLAGKYNSAYADRVDHKHDVTITHEVLVLEAIETARAKLVEHVPARDNDEELPSEGSG